MNLHVRRDDNVVILSGRDKGKQGKVLEVSPKEGKIIVEGCNMVKKHMKPKRMGETGGIMDAEAPMYACKAMVVCPKCQKPTRVAHKAGTNGKNERVCKKCGATL